MACHRADSSAIPACLAIAQALPDFFNAEGLAQMALDLALHELWVAEGPDGQVTGFLSLKELSPTASELSWMAVHPAQRRQGVGKALLAAAMANLAERDVVILEVKTLATSARHKPYLGTMAFYLAQGFTEVVVWKGEQSPWGPKQPCAVLQRML